MKKYTMDSKEGSIPDSVVMRESKDGEYVLAKDADELIIGLQGVNEMRSDEIDRQTTHINSLETKLHEVQTNALVLYEKIQELESRCKYLDDARDTAVDALCEMVAMVRDEN